MVTFKIETQHAISKGWESVLTVKPDYHFVTSHIRRWLIFTRRVVVAMNPDDAEEVAQAKAVAVARSLARRCRCRINRVAELDGCKDTRVIWQDGRSTEPGVVQRVINWWYG